MSQVGGEGHSLPQTLTEPSTSIQTDLFFFLPKTITATKKKKKLKRSVLCYLAATWTCLHGGCWPKLPSQQPNEVAIKPYHTQSCHHPKNLEGAVGGTSAPCSMHRAGAHSWQGQCRTAMARSSL